MVGNFCIFTIIVILSIIINRIIFSKKEKEKNLKELITKEFGCIYCKNFYYNNDGSGG